MSVATFDSTKRPLQDFLKEIATGKMQLPDFQRGWVWDDDRIRSLLASLSASFPIGAIMTLETGSKDVRFKPRPVQGADPAVAEVDPEILILDGQQRLTSLYQSLMGSEAVRTKDLKGKKVERWYYIDMKLAVAAESDREESVRSVPETRLVKAFGGQVTLDLTSPEREFAEDLFPAQKIFDSAEWRQGYSEHWRFDADKMRLFNEFERVVIKRFEQYHLPVITLGKETPKEAVCLVFEKVNTGGVALTVFDLVTASFAAENFQLRDDWSAREKRLKGAHLVLRGLQSDDFLQVLSLLVTQARANRAIGCKRRDILRLEVADYEEWADRAEKGFVDAARFLHSQKIFTSRDVPYRTQLVPLTAILVTLGDQGENDGARRAIARWFWCGVLGELYGGATETRFARDLPEVVALVRGKAKDTLTIQDGNFQPNRLLTLRTRNSAAYKGIHALLMRDGSEDFRTAAPIEAQTFFDDKIDIHHIFPKAWCQKNGIESNSFDSIINKTGLSARTNRMIGGRAPSKYLPRLEQDAGIEPARMNEILSTHGIMAETLRADDYEGFFAQRAELLLQRIESVMGKQIGREPGVFTSEVAGEDYDDGPLDWEQQPLEESAA